MKVQNACALAAVVAALSPATAVAAGPIQHRWPGDGNAADVVGTAHGTLGGGAAFAPGRNGLAFAFDGIDDRVSFGSAAGNFGSGDFTVTFWMQTTVPGSQGIIGKRPTCSHGSFWDIRGGASTIATEVDGPAGYQVVHGPLSAGDGMFHHVALARSGGVLRMLVDGSPFATAVYGGPTDPSNAVNLIAGRSTCTGFDGTTWFTGRLDDIRMLNVSDHQPPAVTVGAPADEATFIEGEPVTVDFGCTDSVEVESCTGSTADGAPLDTSTPGTHSFTVTATDAAGYETKVTRSYTVVPGNLPPVASIVAGPHPFVTGDAITFALSASDPDGHIASVQWDLGTGSFGPPSGDPQNQIHHFVTPGIRVVRALVTDNEGKSVIASVTINVQGLACTKIGTAGNDVLKGAANSSNTRRDVICGLGGRDTIEGGYGDDVLVGGAGDDTLRGHHGNDEIYGGLGFDTLEGSYGDDFLHGRDGRADRRVDCHQGQDRHESDENDPRAGCESIATATSKRRPGDRVKRSKAAKRAKARRAQSGSGKRTARR